MTKRMKKLTAMLLAGMLAAQGSMSVMALDSIDADDTVTLASNAALFDVLNYVESQKVFFGLNDVDFSDLELGNPIHTYEYLPSGFMEGITVYPLFVNGEVVATAKSPEGTYYQIDTGPFVDNLNAYVDSSIALVYDNDSIYLFEEDAYTKLADIEYEMSERASLENTMLYDDDNYISTSVGDLLCFERVSPVASLHYPAHTASSTDAYYRVSVENMGQTGSSNCWAACVAVVSNTVNGTNLSCDDVVDTVAESEGMNANTLAEQGRYPTDYAVDMREIFNLTNYYYRNVASSASTNTAEEYILYSIQNTRPAIGSFYYNDPTSYVSLRHAVVICGVDTDSNYITVMNPSGSEGGFHTAFMHNNAYSFTKNQSATWRMDQGVFYVTSTSGLE